MQPSTSAPPDKGFFRPEALAARKGPRLGSVLLHQPLGYYAAAMVSLTLLALMSAFAYFGTYTRKATVAGLLMPEQGLFRLVAPSGGQIGVVNAHEGQAVVAGQPLFTLTTSQLTSSGPTHALVREQLQRRLDLAKAGAEFANHRESRERTLMAQRMEAMDAEAAQIDNELTLIARREDLATAQRERVRRQADAGFVSPAQLEQAEGELLALRQQKHGALRARSALRRDRAALQTMEEDVRARHQEQLTQSEATLAILRQELAEAHARRESISAAPFAGTVTGVHAHEGSTVGAGTLLASLIPEGAKLVAHLYASEEKSGFLEIGQKVGIRYAAYPYQKYGMASGVVVGIAQSPYALAELPAHVAMALQPPAAGQSLYYRVTVALDGQSITAQGREQKLKAGMVLEADLLQDTRRLYEWALEPIYSVTGKGLAGADMSRGK